jgi:hypothetical protein
MINIIHRECDKSVAKDKKLPTDSYIVGYIKDGNLTYDIARGTKVELFDHYYDNFRCVKSIEWTDGVVNPKLYDYVPRESKKKK